MTIALDYHEVQALDPSGESFKRVAKLLGGKKGWNGKKIDAAAAKAAGCTFYDIIWAASALARRDADVERRLRLFMCDCAARVLHIAERNTNSLSARNAIIVSRRFARGEATEQERDAAWAAARDAARAAEEQWQFDRLIARLSDQEPEDWPLPAVPVREAA